VDRVYTQTAELGPSLSDPPNTIMRSVDATVAEADAAAREADALDADAVEVEVEEVSLSRIAE
jgi:hypothetical protein